jgi:Cu(I)/Ag(I) efflux system membrane fusion protein
VKPRLIALVFFAFGLAIGGAAGQQPQGKILYYRDPMGKPEYSAEPRKDSMGMDYIPVYEGEENGGQAPPPTAAPAAAAKGKILYYRNPMGLPETSPVPKKDSMGMDYIPVYEGEASDETATVKIGLAKVQKLGVQTAPIERRLLDRTIRAVGTVQADERRLYVVNTKFDGWIEKLYVNATGEVIRRGEPLMEIYAPDLVVAEREYLLAWRSLRDMADAGPEIRKSASQLAEAALQRLSNWDISADQVKRLQRAGTVTRALTLRAPADGTVMEKMAVEGMHFTAGDPLYRIADLSSVWLTAEVFEQDIGLLRRGQNATITVNAYPGTEFTGKVDFVYPTVSQETRTAKVRIVVPNADGRLKTGMYADVAVNTAVGDGPVLAVPDSAVIDSGTRQAVLIERGEGTFEPREVKLGAHADGFYQVRQGLSGGERVVVSANFLIDAESNLRAALKAFIPPEAKRPEQ